MKKKKPLLITNKETTRFFLSLEQGTNFVIDCLSKMKGGEIFVPKIPSMKIIDLADYISPMSKKKIIGLRPGEKIHEVMIQADELNVIEFKNFFIIKPTIELNNPKDFFQYNNVKGKKTKIGFSYDSLTNSKFLSKDKIKNFLKKYI